MTDYTLSAADGMWYYSSTPVFDEVTAQQTEEPVVIDDEPFLSVEGALVLGLVVGILLGFIFGRRQ